MSRAVRRPSAAPRPAEPSCPPGALPLAALLGVSTLAGAVLQRPPASAGRPYAENMTVFGRHLARALRTAGGRRHLPDGADGWCHGGCWPLARALAHWARTHGWHATVVAVRGWHGHGADAELLPEHLVCRITDAGGDTVYLDGDGVAQADEILARLAAEGVRVHPRLARVTRAACRAGGIDEYPMFGDEPLVAFLHAVVDPFVRAAAAATTAPPTPPAQRARRREGR